MINEFDGISKFRNHYPKYKGLDFLYDSENHIIPSNELFKKPQNEHINQNKSKLTSDFYEGFGIEI